MKIAMQRIMESTSYLSLAMVVAERRGSEIFQTSKVNVSDSESGDKGRL